MTGQQGYSNATSGAGTRPTGGNDGTNDYVRFNGSSQFLTLSGSGVSAASYHIFLVANTTLPAALRPWWHNAHLAAPASGTTTSLGMIATGAGRALQASTSPTTISTATSGAGALRLLEHSNNAGSRSIKWDNAAATNNTGGLATYLANGYIGTTGTTYLGFDLYEMIWFPAVLSGADRTALLGYINTRYSLSAT
jgi:hypothetical protein